MPNIICELVEGQLQEGGCFTSIAGKLRTSYVLLTLEYFVLVCDKLKGDAPSHADADHGHLLETHSTFRPSSSAPKKPSQKPQLPR